MSNIIKVKDANGNWVGIPALRGESGITPHIGENGNWWIGEEDTNILAGEAYELPIASNETLGGIKITDDFEINELGEASVKNTRDSEKLGGENPDYYATVEQLENKTRQIGGQNYILNSDFHTGAGSCSTGITSSLTEDGYIKVVSTEDNGNWQTFPVVNRIAANFKEGDVFTFSMEIKSEDSTIAPTIYFGDGYAYQQLEGTVGTEFSTIYCTSVWKGKSVNFHLGWKEAIGTYYIGKAKFERGAIPTDYTDGIGQIIGGRIAANAQEFTITEEMMGRRIICSTTTGRKINLPSPSAVRAGAVVEICTNMDKASQFIEVWTPSGNIYKGDIVSPKCIQPGKTMRQYVSTGSHWRTDFIPVNPSDEVIVIIDETEGSDSELIYKDYSYEARRCFAGTYQMKHLSEFYNIGMKIIGEVTLNSSLTFTNKTLRVFGDNKATSTLVIPSDYRFNLNDTNLRIVQLSLKIEGAAFYVTGNIGVLLGGYDGVNIYPLANSSYQLFYYQNFGVSSNLCGLTSLTLGLNRCYFKVDNLEEYTSTAHIFSEYQGNSYNKGNILIDLSSGVGWGSKADSIKWCNNSANDTMSRIGTSGIYVLG